MTKMPEELNAGFGLPKPSIHAAAHYSAFLTRYAQKQVDPAEAKALGDAAILIEILGQEVRQLCWEAPQEPDFFGDPERGCFVVASHAKLLGFDNSLYSLPLYVAPPVPAAVPVVGVPGMPSTCQHCDGDALEWFTHRRVASDVRDGRLRAHDVSVDFVLRCLDCSETLMIVPADRIAAMLATHAPTSEDKA